MPDRATVPNEMLREVVNDIEYVFNSVFDKDDVITQNLREGTRVKNIKTDDEVMLREDGDDVEVTLRILTNKIGDELVETLQLVGANFIDRDIEPEPEVMRSMEEDNDVGRGGQLVDDYEDQRVDVDMEGNVGRVVKPFDHEDADYREPGDDDFDPNHQRCRDCAHYDDNGNCHIVEDIEPDAYCSNFFADFGVFGHRHPGFVELNLSMVGDAFNWSTDDAESFIEKVADELRGIING